MLARSEPLRKPFSGSSTSENFPSRDCLKIRERLQTGTCEAAKGAKKKALVRPIATSGTHHRVYFNPFSDSLRRVILRSSTLLHHEPRAKSWGNGSARIPDLGDAASLTCLLQWRTEKE